MDKIIIYTDGGSRGNPGPSAFGVVFTDIQGNIIKKYSQYIGKTTNNEAEYQGLIFALKKAKQLFGREKAKNLPIEIRSDSKLLVSQMNGKYKILNPRIQRLFLEAWNLKIDYNNLEINLVPREQNKLADQQVNQALDYQTSNQRIF